MTDAKVTVALDRIRSKREAAEKKKDAAEVVQSELHALILKAHRLGAVYSDLQEASGYSRAYIGRILSSQRKVSA